MRICKKGNGEKRIQVLYSFVGLHQAPRVWNFHLDKFLKGLGFFRCPYEHAVYTKRKYGDILVVGVYVDEFLVTGSSVVKIEEFKTQMNSEFEMSDMWLLSYYLSIEIIQSSGEIILMLSPDAKKVLDGCGMVDCNCSKFPMKPKLKLCKDEKGIVV